MQRQDTDAVVEPVTPQTNTKRRVRVRIRYFTYRSSAKKEIRAQNGKNQAQGKTVLAGIHARFARIISHAILYRSMFSSGLLVSAPSSQSTSVVPSRYAAQHRVATDAPIGAFKIGPILVKACAIYPISPLQGAAERYPLDGSQPWLCGNRLNRALIGQSIFGNWWHMPLARGTLFASCVGVAQSARLP